MAVTTQARGWSCGVALVGLFLAVASTTEARQVTVWIYEGDELDPTDPNTSVSFTAQTHSASEDEKAMGDPDTVGSVANGIVRSEADNGYLAVDLAPLERTGLARYIARNRPTRISFCTGHVLLLANGRFRQGEVPAMSAPGDALYPAARKWGRPARTTLFGSWITKPGDVVFFSGDDPKKPGHVAAISDRWWDYTVISKDQAERVYELSLNRVLRITNGTSMKYKRAEVWRIPWSTLSVKVIAGECLIGPIESPTTTWVGDRTQVSFRFRVPHPPAGAMVVETKATLTDARGQVCYASDRKKTPTRRTGTGDDACEEGEASFETTVAEPGAHRWILEVFAQQASDEDEGLALYEPDSAIQEIQVQARPRITIETLSVEDAEVQEGGSTRLHVKYRITDLPPIGGKQPCELTRAFEHKLFQRFSAEAEPRQVTIPATPPPPRPLVRAVEVDRTVPLKVGAKGPASVRLVLRLKVPGLDDPIEAEKVAEYVVRRTK